VVIFCAETTGDNGKSIIRAGQMGTGCCNGLVFIIRINIFFKLQEHLRFVTLVLLG
jgi:hypothetical protein